MPGRLDWESNAVLWRISTNSVTRLPGLDSPRCSPGRNSRLPRRGRQRSQASPNRSVRCRLRHLRRLSGVLRRLDTCRRQLAVPVISENVVERLRAACGPPFLIELLAMISWKFTRELAITKSQSLRIRRLHACLPKYLLKSRTSPAPPTSLPVAALQSASLLLVRNRTCLCFVA
jgi:hypothetical protein